jgi:hypothetical protein
LVGVRTTQRDLKFHPFERRQQIGGGEHAKDRLIVSPNPLPFTAHSSSTAASSFALAATLIAFHARMAIGMKAARQKRRKRLRAPSNPK